jgi:hypothetical protein
VVLPPIIDPSQRSILWGIAVLGAIYTSAYALAGLFSMAMPWSGALHVSGGRLVFILPVVFSIRLSDIERVDVDRTREQFPGRVFKATVRVRRKRGRPRYIRTEMLDTPAAQIAELIQAQLGSESLADIFD